ncbi:CDP-glucose 4,6-dehydratase [bacterium (Candidatus Blackallbacteria) CG17_big_fil_post_rev_8_21_14_2_50_48_46]|uniref:CDP-glucose 4,6-dehydratase n=1 Tax=bacterium (Candidatus Blackallbacteria) CG17_big_fil_post_rev_8_21_14_2_50_48_46 TaxID=2014261 RepID=A0A2M7GA98_9BACT|nr:MAG: CDP-glucose 4,6-dehydratase [bacterium (Candidatus Blackallbacteria) CG18_big_fil_WC_8_21_14_2_50_49_26]PIW19071.1 MAG: CDP-glucose 4,6-dehydratase [bacterium (Candidatus Blackallbacteria) CG17_big_fil_post_rev_8_21_14_2_50_48_46]PIW44562.1 MAG: CDP-glucose 4,6-dehydratase [bacterium (Candidatus Blackallbacteria) CG13_big_fil_rev_8_21_14_2_50_49_14]
MFYDPLFWSGKKVFLTGQTGFKGAWLSLWLSFLGAKITGFALPPATNPNLFELLQLEQDLQSISGDIRNPSELQQALQNAQPEIVIHMAAQALVRPSYQFPQETFATNIMGTVHLLEAIRATPGIRVVLNITTDKCYENTGQTHAFQENHPLGGHDPYSASKACSELVTASYRDSFFHADRYTEHGLAIASARAGNVIGGGDWSPERLIPDILAAMRQKQALVIRHPEACRPWQFVLEPLQGYLRLIEKLWQQGPLFNGAWNFGPAPEKTQTVGWIVQELQKYQPEAEVILAKGPQPHEAAFLQLDSSKARTQLGWTPQLEIEETLAWIMEWHQAHQAGGNMRELTENQIQKYQKRVSANS